MSGQLPVDPIEQLIAEAGLTPDPANAGAVKQKTTPAPLSELEKLRARAISDKLDHDHDIHELLLKQKKKVAKWIIRTLWAELAFTAVLMLLQGWGEKINFTLSQWAFTLFINIIVIQAYATFRIVVENLFPKNGK